MRSAVRRQVTIDVWLGHGAARKDTANRIANSLSPKPCNHSTSIGRRVLLVAELADFGAANPIPTPE